MRQFLAGLLAAAVLALQPCAASAQDGRATGAALVLDITGAIGPATAEYVHRGLTEAARRRAKAIVLRLDTPGGLSSSMHDIIRDILGSSVPVFAYVAPDGARAASAGTYIVYASHIAAMAPSTHLGAATPVQIGGGLFGGAKRDTDKKSGDKKDNTKAIAPDNPEEAKTVNDAVAYIRSLAQLRGRNAAWAEQAVREAATLTASEARGKNVVDLIAGNIPALLAAADGRTVKIGDSDITLHSRGLTLVMFAPNWRTQILAIITNPNIAYLLLLAGIYGIMFEFFSPGAYFPGVLGAIALLVGLYALNLMPVSYAGAGLLLLGIAMLIAEAFIPSFGVVGIGGVAAFAIGSLFLFRGDVPGYRIAWPVVAATTLFSAAFLALVLTLAWRAYRRKPVTGDAALVGDSGEVLIWQGDGGDVLVHGERWRATSKAPLRAGQRVRVTGRDKLILQIEPDVNA